MKITAQNKIKYILPIAIVLSLTIVFSKSYAQEVLRTFTISPVASEIALNPGEKTEGTMKIINDTGSPLTFEATTQDFIVDGPDGTPRLLTEATLDNKYSAAAWLAVAPGKITVKAHDRQVVNYYIQAPEDARPGGHYAAVVFKPTTNLGVKGTGASVNTQVGSLFYVNIKGPIKEEASISKFLSNFFSEYGPIDIFTQIKNSGDLHIKPKGSIVVTSLFGGKNTVELNESNVFPGGGVRNYENKVGQKWMFGPYTAKLAASYGQANNLPLNASITFWVFPWKIAMLIVLVTALIALGILYINKGKKHDGHKDQKEDDSPVAPVIPTPEG